jgi:glutamate/tyrosine decarboxylase-like PLP-dependent enzyme
VEQGLFTRGQEELRILGEALRKMGKEFPDLPPAPSQGSVRKIEEVLNEVAVRLGDNYPYFHPLYAGQMIKPPHPVSRLAYALAMWLNPNNHALDGGRASSLMEKEAVAGMAGMLGWDEHLGHLCGGGTMANLEALWIAGRLKPEGTTVASRQAHYTHERISRVLKQKFEALPCDRLGRMDLEALESRLGRGDIGTVVATVGTTATGSVDTLPGLLELRRKYGFRLHADAAYGGYFILAGNLASETRRAYDLLHEADSVVIDPHKHGLQPYGCGCIIFRDPQVARFYRHDSPYTYFSSSETHLGEISLECSRPGAAAVGLWATQKLLPLIRGGEFARGLERSRDAALALHAKLASDERFITAFSPELDIVVWAPRSGSVSKSSETARRIFLEAGRRRLHLALAELPAEFFDLAGAGIERDRDSMTCLRSVLMKPEHCDWIEEIWSIIAQSARAAAGRRDPG